MSFFTHSASCNPPLKCTSLLDKAQLLLRHRRLFRNSQDNLRNRHGSNDPIQLAVHNPDLYNLHRRQNTRSE